MKKRAEDWATKGIFLAVFGCLVLALVGPGWLHALGAFLFVWFWIFFFALLVDEDVNHWSWPHRSGPGVLATTRMAVLSGLLAAVPGTFIYWLVTRT